METMYYHYDKLFYNYITSLNEILKKHPYYQQFSLEQLLRNSLYISPNIREDITNFAGGVYNHYLYFNSMTNLTTKPSAVLQKQIEKDFKSMNNFLSLFEQLALAVFGSGYVFLACDSTGKLFLLKTTNQDTPFHSNLNPLLCIDIWEHAYYLQYPANRAQYITLWLTIINWNNVNMLYEKAVSKNPH